MSVGYLDVGTTLPWMLHCEAANNRRALSLGRLELTVSPSFAPQVMLPPSMGAALMDQGAPKNGAMLFELSLPAALSASAGPSPTPSSSSAHSTTHCGVYDFTAPEGTVLVPRKVAQSLWGFDSQPSGKVIVTYK